MMTLQCHHLRKLALISNLKYAASAACRKAANFSAGREKPEKTCAVNLANFLAKLTEKM
jgi:hypothetical protein